MRAWNGSLICKNSFSSIFPFSFSLFSLGAGRINNISRFDCACCLELLKGCQPIPIRRSTFRIDQRYVLRISCQALGVPPATNGEDVKKAALPNRSPTAPALLKSKALKSAVVP